MALTPKPAWKDAAAAGTPRPVLLFELRPTVLYAEACNSDDWCGGVDLAGASLRASTNVSNLDPSHPTGELRLNTAEIEHPVKQGRYAALPYKFTYDADNSDPARTSDSLTYEEEGQFHETFRTAEAVRLLRLKIGLFNSLDGNHKSYRGKTIVRLWSHVNTTPDARFGREQIYILGKSVGGWTYRGLFRGAREFARAEIDHSLDSSDGVNAPRKGYEYDSDSLGNYWRIIDFSGQDVYLPGGNVLCAIDLYADTATDAEHLQLRGSLTDDYADGQFMMVERRIKSALTLDGDLGFAFVVQGHATSGVGVFTLDLGETPSASLDGELELKYWQPAGTRVRFQCRESANFSSWTVWRDVTDSSALKHYRYVQVKATLYSDSNHLYTPRIYSIRAAYKRSDKFVMADGPVLGYPAIVADAPDYSSEGDPLAGSSVASDTSQFRLLDGGGMASRLFELYNLKNDEIRISLGFDASGFTEADYLPLKTLWIEDWRIEPNQVVVSCYDQQVRFKEAEAPALSEGETDYEQVHFAGRLPGQVKADLLALAQIRPSRVDSSNNFAALDTAFPWSLFHVISEPTSLQKIDENLNRHLLAFMTVSESGKWVCRWADFSATPVASLSGDDIILNSERFYPGRKSLKNYVAVFFGRSGESNEETGFEGAAVDYDPDSEKENKEYAVDKLLSWFIPAGTDNGAITAAPRLVANRRLNLQRNGVRTIEFSTRAEFAWLQIGDHISLTSTLYARPGASSPNPLLVMLTRKEIDRGLGMVHWGGMVLKDSDETCAGLTAVEPPTGFGVTDDGSGGVAWAWTASVDDNGTYIDRYELFQRLGLATAWGAPKAAVAATGAASYSFPDTQFSQLVEYDFGVQAVHVDGRRSAMVTVENHLLAAAAPSAPSGTLLKIDSVAGGFYASVKTDVSGANHYKFYVRYDSAGWRYFGRLAAGLRSRLFWSPPENVTIKSSGLVGFAFTAVDTFGQESAICEPQPAARWAPAPTNSAIDGSADTPTAPSFDAGGGTYPLISHIATGPYQGHAITLKLLPATDEADDIEHYELERRDDGGTGKTSWGEWSRLPDYIVKQSFLGRAAAKVIYYENRDVQLKPGRYYQFRALAVHKNGLKSAWSTSAEKLLSEDTTAPDKPTLSVTALPLGLVLLISTPTQGGGAPCGDFDYFKIEGSSNSGSSYSVLAAQHKSVLFHLNLANAAMAQTWRFRVTAYDTSKNASPVSDATADYSPSKIDAEDCIIASSVVTGLLAFTPLFSADGTGDIVATLNASAEGLDIATSLLTIDGDVVFEADAEIYGQIKLVNTSDLDERIEIGSFDGDPEIRLYGDNTLTARLRLLATEDVNIAILNLMASDPLEFGNTYASLVCGWGFDPGPAGALYLPDAAYIAETYNLATGTRAKAFWDATAHKLKILEGSTTYTISPD